MPHDDQPLLSLENSLTGNRRQFPYKQTLQRLNRKIARTDATASQPMKAIDGIAGPPPQKERSKYRF